MKKQLLFLVVAIFAISFSTAYGQVICPAPRPVDIVCLPSDALHPLPGTPYDYTVVVPTPPGTKQYTWFVTQDQNFIAAGALTGNRETAPGVHIAASGAGYNDPATGAATINLTWKYWVPDPAQPVFVVINVQNTASTPDACVTMNMKVFKIEPIFAFTLDLANVNPAGTVSAYEAPLDRCIHDIVSATYDATAPEGVLYDFGVDYLYYAVTAANFTTSWRPSLQIVSGLDPLETITAVEWARPADLASFPNPNAMPLVGGIYTSTDPVLALDPTGTVGAAGECIIIRVTIDHTNGANQYQGLAAQPILIAVDGVTQLALPTPLGDLHFSSTVPAPNALCGLADGFQFDRALQNLNPRPNITAPTMPAPGLLPVKP